MKPKTRSRVAKAVACAVTVAALALPVSAMANKPKDTNKQTQKLPKKLRSFKTPLKKRKNNRLIKKGTAKYGPGKKMLPRFKKKASKKARSEAIRGLDRTMGAFKAEPGMNSQLVDAVKVWESMTYAQKDAVLSESASVSAAWPVAVAATAAVVTAAVAVTDLAYKVYVDQRDNTGDDDEEETDEDTGDTGDTGVITGALSY